jgi:glycosyltransferase involved in cell wall biosynthesis
MRSSSPDVSIIVPCFNQGRFLPSLIRSLQRSSQRAIEVILIDDGSTDGLVARVAAEFPKPTTLFELILRRTPNRGLAATRNLGLGLSSGRFVKFLDADDLLLPGSLDVQIDHLGSNPDTHAHLIGYCLANHDLSAFRPPDRDTLPTRPLSAGYVATAWETELSIPIHCALFRREFIEDVPFREDLEAKEDWVFWHELARKNPHLAVDREVGVVYRLHLASMTRSRSRMARYWLKAFASMSDSGTRLAPSEFARVAEHFNTIYFDHVNHGHFDLVSPNSITIGDFRIGPGDRVA